MEFGLRECMYHSMYVCMYICMYIQDSVRLEGAVPGFGPQKKIFLTNRKLLANKRREVDNCHRVGELSHAVLILLGKAAWVQKTPSPGLKAQVRRSRSRSRDLHFSTVTGTVTVTGYLFWQRILKENEQPILNFLNPRRRMKRCGA